LELALTFLDDYSNVFGANHSTPGLCLWG